jgi:hypothetical protein
MKEKIEFDINLKQKEYEGSLSLKSQRRGTWTPCREEVYPGKTKEEKTVLTMRSSSTSQPLTENESLNQNETRNERRKPRKTHFTISSVKSDVM